MNKNSHQIQMVLNDLTNLIINIDELAFEINIVSVLIRMFFFLMKALFMYLSPILFLNYHVFMVYQFLLASIVHIAIFHFL